jgi:hypothetical protein
MPNPLRSPATGIVLSSAAQRSLSFSEQAVSYNQNQVPKHEELSNHNWEFVAATQSCLTPSLAAEPNRKTLSIDDRQYTAILHTPAASLPKQLD